jgi:carbamoyl-phosphate synthase small subunit
VEGIQSKSLDIIAVQYLPEAYPGPHCTTDHFFSSVVRVINGKNGRAMAGRG